MTPPRSLHLADWRATKDTLHLYSQIVGKVRLATTAPRNHWWNVPLYVDVRGLTTRPLHHPGATFEITIDFVDHAVIVRRLTAARSRSSSATDCRADFDSPQGSRRSRHRHQFKEEPYGLPMTTPFPEDSPARVRTTAKQAARLGSRASSTGRSIPRLGGSSAGCSAEAARCTSSGTGSTSADSLVLRRGRAPPDLPGARVQRRARNTAHEVVSFGFSAGDDTVGDAAYYAYTAPEPEGLREQPLPVGAWTQSGNGSLALLPVRDRPHGGRPPNDASSPSAKARTRPALCLAGWDTTAFSSRWCPTPAQLERLQASAAGDLGRPTRFG